MRYSLALLALLLAPALAHAQESAAVRAAVQHVRDAAAAARLAPSADLDDLHAAHVAADRRTGATFVKVVQRHRGVPVWNAITPVAVAATGRVHMAAGAVRVEAGLAERANGAVPALDGEAALSRAIAHVGPLRPDARPAALADDPASDASTPTAYAAVGAPELVYQPTESGAVRLAWALTIEGTGGGHEMWAVRVDAQSGAVLAADDLVVRHTARPAAEARPSFAPLATPAAPAAAGAHFPDTYVYRVYPMPIESPTHGEAVLVASPADPEASQLGWHDTGSAVYELTRGNNAWAYEDRDASDSGTGTAPSSAKTFDYTYDLTLPPNASTDAAVVNLFYWGNIVHDVMWHYGFDEASGNYQMNNFGRGGAGNDAVRLEAQDGSGTDNANFSFSPDGSPGRMQMYEWTAAPEFEILAPPEIAGLYGARGAEFGASSGTVTAAGVLALDLGGNPSRGCTVADVGNPADVAGQVFVVQRGDCNFVEKARVGEALGAAGVAIYNCEVGSVGCNATSPTELISMACPDGENCADVTIPAVFVQASTGDALASSPTLPQVRLSLGGANRDSDFDAGIIAHEYGHGISGRLVGINCLGNTEQMGEGWSDYVGLMLTQQVGDTAAEPRGVGTHVVFEPTDGVGIRNAPYSTDFTINDFTYQDVIAGGGTTLSVPHGIGFVWATVLWEMTWELIEDFGYDPDVYNAEGMAGNQIALNLVLTGLKETPCNPGFVTGRDAILAADEILYGGAHRDQIWAAFARRGLGQNASQGSSNSVNDGTADFTAPPVAAETLPGGQTVSLTVAGANPFRGTTTMALTLPEAQTVRVELVDLLGRTVATVHDGPLGAEAHALPVSAAGLAPGVYLVRAVGDGFALTERVTVTR